MGWENPNSKQNKLYIAPMQKKNFPRDNMYNFFQFTDNKIRAKITV